MRKVENHYQKHVVVSTNNTKNREQLEKYVAVFYYLKKNTKSRNLLQKHVIFNLLLHVVDFESYCDCYCCCCSYSSACSLFMQISPHSSWFLFLLLLLLHFEIYRFLILLLVLDFEICHLFLILDRLMRNHCHYPSRERRARVKEIQREYDRK